MLATALDLKWQVTAAQKCGRRHAKCEDAYSVAQPSPGVLVIVVADGAGSAEFAEAGAKTAAAAGSANVCAGLERAGDELDDEAIRNIFAEAMGAALAAVQAEAERCEVDCSELASTLILLLAHSEFVAAAQIGDGATVIADEAGHVLGLTVPPQGEYINETIFLTSKEALESVQFNVWRGRAARVAAFSDGLQMLCLKWPEYEPHAAFFTPLFKFAGNRTDEEQAAAELAAFIDSERVSEQTDDDVTLVLAVLRNEDHDNLES